MSPLHPLRPPLFDDWRDLRLVNHFVTVPRVQRAAGFTTTVEAGTIHVAQTTVGANKVAEYMIAGVITDDFYELRSQALAVTHFRFRAFVGPYLRTNPTATTFAGIELGGFGTVTPFAANPTAAITQLRMRGDNDTVELLSAVGDGTAAVVQSFNIGSIQPHGLILELDYDWPRRKVTAYADGTLLGVATNFSELGAAPSLDGNYSSIFASGGSHAAAACETWFSMAEIMIFNGRGNSQ